MMPLLRLCLLVLCTVALPARAADAGLYTIVDGEARVLRGTTWFDLIPGTPMTEGDVLDVREGGTVQVELPRGSIVNLAGPAQVYAAAVPATGASDWVFVHGWTKASSTPGTPLRFHAPAFDLELANGVVVAQFDTAQAGAFVENGLAKVTVPTGKGKPPMAAGDLRDGEYVSRAGDRAPAFGDRAPVVFVTAMPRQMRDPLPKLSRHFQGKPAPLVPGREISMAEAEPWLAGPARAAFVKRLAPRLKDPEFRAAVMARAAAYPEWGRQLRPEPNPSTNSDRPAEADHRPEAP